MEKLYLIRADTSGFERTFQFIEIKVGTGKIQLEIIAVHLIVKYMRDLPYPVFEILSFVFLDKAVDPRRNAVESYFGLQ